MNSFISALFGELSLALVFLFMCSPIALLPLFYLLQYLSYFPRFYLGRMRLAAKLESVAKTYDLEFYRHRPCFYYGKIGQTDCEFSLVTPRARSRSSSSDCRTDTSISR